MITSYAVVDLKILLSDGTIREYHFNSQKYNKVVDAYRNFKSFGYDYYDNDLYGEIDDFIGESYGVVSYIYDVLKFIRCDSGGAQQNIDYILNNEHCFKSIALYRYREDYDITREYILSGIRPVKIISLKFKLDNSNYDDVSFNINLKDINLSCSEELIYKVDDIYDFKKLYEGASKKIRKLLAKYNEELYTDYIVYYSERGLVRSLYGLIKLRLGYVV